MKDKDAQKSNVLHVKPFPAEVKREMRVWAAKKDKPLYQAVVEACELMLKTG